MINNVIIAGSILMFICVFFTTFDYGNLLPESLDNHICMVGSDVLVSLFGYKQCAAISRIISNI